MMVLMIGVLVGAAVVAPVAFMLGLCAALDRKAPHELADIGPALRRSR